MAATTKEMPSLELIHEAAEVRKQALSELGFHPNHGRTK